MIVAIKNMAVTQGDTKQHLTDQVWVILKAGWGGGGVLLYKYFS